MTWTEDLVTAIDAAVGGVDPGDWRTHLGMSGIGGSCERKCWFTYNWNSAQNRDGRIKRLLDRGHEEEHRFERYLKKSGIPIHQAQAKFTSRVQGFGGSIDGYVFWSDILPVLERFGSPNIPDIPLTTCIGVDFKTSNKSKFNGFVKRGLFAESSAYFGQAQSYMHASRDPHWSNPVPQLEFFLYFFVCKDNDELHIETVHYHAAYASQLETAADNIISAESPYDVERISESPTWWECKPSMCSHTEVCHFGATPARNCRTCDHVEKENTAMRTVRWSCGRTNKPLQVEDQRKGCSEYARLQI